MAETVTGLELFAFVILPIGVAASAWGFILVAERRRAAKAGPGGRDSDATDRS